MATPQEEPQGILIDAALDAAGLGPISSVWHMFFPADEPMFSEAQMEQLTNAIQGVVDQAHFEQVSAMFDSASTSMNTYVNEPTGNHQLLLDVYQDSQSCADQFMICGSKAIELYLASMSLNLIALKFMWELAPEGEKPQALHLIGSTALNALSQLNTLEGEMISDGMSLDQFCNFKIYTSLGPDELPLDPAVAPLVGSEYRDKIIKLIGLVSDYAPDLMGQIPVPTQALRFFAADTSYVHPMWQSWNSSNGSTVGTATFYKVDTTPPGGASNTYRPLGDLCLGGFTPQPSWVPFIRNIADSGNVQNTPAWNYIFDDHGSGNPADLSVWWGGSPDQSQMTIGCVSGTGEGGWSGESPPGQWDYCAVSGDALTTQELAEHFFEVHYSQDCIVYPHPQFGQYGLYMLYRSHDRPSPDTAPSINLNCIMGHPYFPSGVA